MVQETKLVIVSKQNYLLLNILQNTSDLEILISGIFSTDFLVHISNILCVKLVTASV